jgi:hypothetical protein
VDDQLIELYHRHAGTGFDRQLRLADFRDRKAPGEKWLHDTPTGMLALGKFTFEAPVLGARREHNNSWLWAWSDRNLKLSLTNRALGDTVRSLVHRLAVHQLGAPAFPLEPLLGTELSEHAPAIFGIILGAELGYDGYHLTDKGRTTILIRDDRLKFTEKQPLSRILTVFPKAVRALPALDHKAALVNYAKDYGVTVAEQPGAVKLTAGRGELTATFDGNRLVKLEGNVPPEKKPAPKPAPKAAPKKPAATPAAKPAPKAAAKKVAAKPAAKQAANGKPAARKAAPKKVAAKRVAGKKK